MSVVITVFNQKGGVGKTTTVVNTGAALAQKGKKVLVVDMDPQGNSTSGLGLYEFDNMIYDFIIDENKETIYKTNTKNLNIIPSNREFAGVELELSQLENWQFRLKKVLDEVKEDYDIIIIDSPPSLGVLSIMSLVASDKILIPVQSEYYALEGVSQLIDTITLVRENFNPNLNILGVLICMFDSRNNLSNSVVDEVNNFFKDKVFKTKIPRNVRLAEAPSFGKSILEYDKFSRGAWAYKKLAKEIIGELDDKK
ncbi:ParA family protein [Peptoniphilus sp. MSJ-1]|uniref:ParA family protein n=1 Tax=Peptoniphilus ovalis TaxID=2841503 RepID=A0ABS6FGT0_9FIRM|nr:ParA family protein [Peptoniphilus ovalis]MBU5668461.1 ParA family protein [Peptoniphilus ovalis]